MNCVFSVNKFKLFKCTFKLSIIIASKKHIILIIFPQKRKKIKFVKFLIKVITFYFRKKAKFDYKKNYRHYKLANFLLNIVININCKMQ